MAQKNYWSADSEALARAFSERKHQLGGDLVLRALRLHCGKLDTSAVDVGGGTGRLAIALAKEGAAVTVLEPDLSMVAGARSRLGVEPRLLRDRICIQHLSGEDIENTNVGQFDIVCCHSVILYLEDPIHLLYALTRMAKPGGIISIVSVNPAATAMREGLRQHWADAIRLINNGCANVGAYLENKKHSLAFIESVLSKKGLTLEAWYGVGVFTDHMDSLDDAGLAVDAEWFAGATEPYRSVARCYHAIFRSAGSS